MSTEKMSSKERMLAAITLQDVDYIPCSFMIFSALRSRSRNQQEFIEGQLKLGLDTVVNIPEFPLRFHPDVQLREWTESLDKEKCPVVHRVYETPAGPLSASVSQTEDWPYGDRLPLFDDYVTPRSKKFLVTEQSDLAKFAYLLQPPSDEEIRSFSEEAKKLKAFAEQKGLAVCGGRHFWSKSKYNEIYGANYEIMGIDALMWTSGATLPLFWTYDAPDMLEELITMISEWNRKRMEIYLNEGVDLLIKRAWYESTEFWSPDLYDRFIAPELRKDIAVTHQAGAQFGYIITSGVMPLLSRIIDLDIDVMIGVDPIQGKGTDMKNMRDQAEGKMCLWGGVNGFLTIEKGEEQEVRAAVDRAFEDLSGESPFILSPVDNVTEDDEKTWKNINTMIDHWKTLRQY